MFWARIIAESRARYLIAPLADSQDRKIAGLQNHWHLVTSCTKLGLGVPVGLGFLSINPMQTSIFRATISVVVCPFRSLAVSIAEIGNRAAVLTVPRCHWPASLRTYNDLARLPVCMHGQLEVAVSIAAVGGGVVDGERSLVFRYSVGEIETCTCWISPSCCDSSRWRPGFVPLHRACERSQSG